MYSNVTEILKRLLFEKGMTVMELSRQTNLPQSTIQRLVAGTTTHPHHSSLLTIANYFGISIKQLQGDEPMIWKTWDQPSIPNLTRIPIISWEDACRWNEIKEKFTFTSETASVWAEKISHSHTFALFLEDNAMHPYFEKDTLIIIDPDKEYYDRCFVLAVIQDYVKATFRQLLMDGKKRYLKPLNTDFTNIPLTELKSTDRICGTLIQARKNY